MKKAFVLVIICTVILSFWGWKKSKTNMTVVLPERSVFFIDKDLSKTFQTSIQNSIQKSYASCKNPGQVMQQATQDFPEILSMKVQICQSDKICFYVDALKPVFLLNNDLVVCDNATGVDLQHFAADVTNNLVRVVGAKQDDLQPIVNFVKALPEKFKQEFLIEWNSDSDVLLQPKDGKSCVLQCSSESAPSLQDLIFCQSIAAAAKSSSKIKKKRVYDVRFKNQIIVR